MNQNPSINQQNVAAKKINNIKVNSSQRSSGSSVRGQRTSYGNLVVIGKGRGSGKNTPSKSKLAAPAPINLPSRKSETLGSETVPAVPTGSSGWGKQQSFSLEEDKLESSQERSLSPDRQSSAWNPSSKDSNPLTFEDSVSLRREERFQLEREEFPSLDKKRVISRSNNTDWQNRDDSQRKDFFRLEKRERIPERYESFRSREDFYSRSNGTRENERPKPQFDENHVPTIIMRDKNETNLKITEKNNRPDIEKQQKVDKNSSQIPGKSTSRTENLRWADIDEKMDYTQPIIFDEGLQEEEEKKRKEEQLQKTKEEEFLRKQLEHQRQEEFKKQEELRKQELRRQEELQKQEELRKQELKRREELQKQEAKKQEEIRRREEQRREELKKQEEQKRLEEKRKIDEVRQEERRRREQKLAEKVSKKPSQIVLKPKEDIKKEISPEKTLLEPREFEKSVSEASSLKKRKEITPQKVKYVEKTKSASDLTIKESIEKQVAIEKPILVEQTLRIEEKKEISLEVKEMKQTESSDREIRKRPNGKSSKTTVIKYVAKSESKDNLQETKIEIPNPETKIPVKLETKTPVKFVETKIDTNSKHEPRTRTKYDEKKYQVKENRSKIVYVPKSSSEIKAQEEEINVQTEENKSQEEEQAEEIEENKSKQETEPPLQSGMVVISKQTGIEYEDDTDFIEIRSRKKTKAKEKIPSEKKKSKIEKSTKKDSGKNPTNRKTETSPTITSPTPARSELPKFPLPPPPSTPAWATTAPPTVSLTQIQLEESLKEKTPPSTKTNINIVPISGAPKNIQKETKIPVSIIEEKKEKPKETYKQKQPLEVNLSWESIPKELNRPKGVTEANTISIKKPQSYEPPKNFIPEYAPVPNLPLMPQGMIPQWSNYNNYYARQFIPPPFYVSNFIPPNYDTRSSLPTKTMPMGYPNPIPIVVTTPLESKPTVEPPSIPLFEYNQTVREKPKRESSNIPKPIQPPFQLKVNLSQESTKRSVHISSSIPTREKSTKQTTPFDSSSTTRWTEKTFSSNQPPIEPRKRLSHQKEEYKPKTNPISPSSSKIPSPKTVFVPKQKPSDNP